MWGKKFGKGKGLCPVSFGLALGVTTFLAVIIWAAWNMVQGIPEVATPHHVFVFTWGATFAYALLAFVKGFIFGFVLAILYDFFKCCCRGCCRDEGMGGKCNCGCGCSCCGGEVETLKGSSTPGKFRA